MFFTPTEYRRLATALFFLCMGCLPAKTQLTYEFHIKPQEFLTTNFEVGAAVGNHKWRAGVYGSWRISTKDSGQIKGLGGGSMGISDARHVNRLLHGYTVGVYLKRNIYLGTNEPEKKNTFLEADLFFRYWGMNDKSAWTKDRFGNIDGGRRTERVRVYGLKFMWGKTVFFSKKEKGLVPYFDIGLGAGVRYQRKLTIYHDNNNRSFLPYSDNYIPSPQVEIRTGFLLKR